MGVKIGYGVVLVMSIRKMDEIQELADEFEEDVGAKDRVWWINKWVSVARICR